MELVSGRLDTRSVELQSKVHSTPSCHFPSVGKGWSWIGHVFSVRPQPWSLGQPETLETVHW